MTTQAEIQAHRSSVDDIVTLAVAELVAQWPSLPLDEPERVRSLLADLMDALVQQFGSVSALLGAEWFADLREQEGPADLFDTVLPDLPGIEQIRAGASYAASALYVDQQKALRDSASVLSGMVANADRDAIAANVRSDRSEPRWARSAQPDACAFCALLASRGPAYRSEETASGADPNHYHNHCGCVAVPTWDPASFQLPEYADRWLDVYDQARSQAGPGAPLSDLLSQMRDIGELR